ncbi:hypothetical protein M997_1763 [Proteus hauseri ATCC 700826]|uniref:Uncharacterized protein n=1 Tax=Proteus hauseri ATCC 700826 TaxID=1354271 RepID=A0AAJ3HSU2_PROHU|nr:hypothetical protein [Proteus hauseri]OAT47236.1 hypothetical protein M997_1763 [Proteus hauseri ATCC 700826]
MEVNSRNNTSIFARIASSIENKFSQLADSLTSIKNSGKIFLFGSEDRKNENIKLICAEIIQRNSPMLNNKSETINEYKLSFKKI